MLTAKDLWITPHHNHAIADFLETKCPPTHRVAERCGALLELQRTPTGRSFLETTV
jgi:hypothetical protein